MKSIKIIKKNKTILYLIILSLIIFGGCMTPKIDYNIEDTYTVTQTNAVGADNRGSVELTSVNEYVVTAVPQDGNTTLQEFIDYAVTNSKDLITFDVDHTFDNESFVTIPDGLDIQPGDGYDVYINHSGTINTGNGTLSGLHINSYDTDENNSYVCGLKWGSYGTGNGQFTNQIRGLAYNHITGYIYASDSQGDRIQYFDTSGTYVGQWGSTGTGNGQFNTPGAIGIDSAGNIYVIDVSNDRIQKFDTSGTYVGQWGSTGTGNGQFSWGGLTDRQDIYIDETDNIYVNDGNANLRIQKFDTSGTYISQFSSQPSGVSYTSVSGSIIGDGTYIYITYPYAKVVVLTGVFPTMVGKFTKEGDYISSFVLRYGVGEKDVGIPNSVIIDSNGNVIVGMEHYAGSSVRRLSVFSPDGTWLYNIKGGLVYYGGVYALIVGENGNLYFTSQANIIKYINISQNDVALLESSTTAGIIRYCSINSELINGVEQYWNINNSIIKSNKKCIIFDTNSSITISGNLQYNLLIGSYAIYFSTITSYVTTTSVSIHHNTIKSTNGILINGLDSADVIKNNIIDCNNIAINSQIDIYMDMITTNNLLNGTLNSTINADSTNQFNINPLFKDLLSVETQDYHLQSKAEGYPIDSIAIGLADSGDDAGCYDMTYTNNGETNKETITLEAQAEYGNDREYNYYVNDSVTFPFRDQKFTFDGDLKKKMNTGVRVIQILYNEALGADISTVAKFEYLIKKEDTLRYHFNREVGLYYLQDDTTLEFSASGSLTFSSTDNSLSAPSGYRFLYDKYTKFYIEVDDTTLKYYYITFNDEDKIYIENTEETAYPTNGAHTCKILWCYVKTQGTEITYENPLTNIRQSGQQGVLPDMNLYVVKTKEG